MGACRIRCTYMVAMVVALANTLACRLVFRLVRKFLGTFNYCGIGLFMDSCDKIMYI